MAKKRAPDAGQYRSVEYALKQIRPLVYSCLLALGKDPRLCELCGATSETKDMEIHHKKYEGATLYDLCFACRSCQLKAENIGLA